MTLTNLRGPLYIDISKRKKGIEKPDSGLDWVGYNRAPHDGPDKGADGRWKSGHGSVKALGDMPDFVGSLHDDDIKQAKGHARSLLQAIEMEEKRRKAAVPTKPKAAVKPIPADLAERVEAIKKRPIPSDIAYLEKELPKLTIAQLEEVYGGKLPSGDKKIKVRDVIAHLATGRLGHEGITHGTHATRADPGGEARDLEFRRRKKLADERGDREEYAALLAGFGTAGTGPGLPPEREVFGGIESITPQNLEDVIVGRQGAEMHARNKAKAKLSIETAAQKRERAQELASQSMVNSNESRARLLEADRLVREAQQAEAGAKAQARTRKPLKVSGAGRISTADLPAAMAEIDAMVANPKDGDEKRLAAVLKRMTVPQLTALAKQHNMHLLGSNKADKIEGLVENLVGFKLDSRAIRGGITTADESSAIDAVSSGGRFGSGTPSAAAKPIPGMAALERKKAKLQNKVDAAESASRESGRTTQSDAEMTARAELQAVDRQIRDLIANAAKALEELRRSLKRPGSVKPNLPAGSRRALRDIESSGGLEMRQDEFQSAYDLSDAEFKLLVDGGLIEFDDDAGGGYIGLTEKGVAALR